MSRSIFSELLDSLQWRGTWGKAWAVTADERRGEVPRKAFQSGVCREAARGSQGRVQGSVNTLPDSVLGHQAGEAS